MKQGLASTLSGSGCSPLLIWLKQRGFVKNGQRMAPILRVKLGKIRLPNHF